MEEEGDGEYLPVTFDRCEHIEGPFFHGTRFTLGVDDQLVPWLRLQLARGPRREQHLLRRTGGNSRLGSGVGHRSSGERTVPAIRYA